MSYTNKIAERELKNALRHPNRVYFSDFLDEKEQAELLPILKRSRRDFVFHGGYEEAARKILVVAPEGDSALDFSPPIIGLLFDKPDNVEHRHVLGSLMSLGITRDIIGDIAIWDNIIQVVVLKRMGEYITNNFHSINGRAIDIKILKSDEIIPYSAPFEREYATAASNRVDAIAASVFKMSRSKVVEAIKQGYLLHNHLPVQKVTTEIKENDTLSLRKKGKVRIKEFNDERTRKGRIRFTYLRFK